MPRKGDPPNGKNPIDGGRKRWKEVEGKQVVADLLRARMKLCKPIVDVLIGFTSIDEDELSRIVAFAALAFKPGETVKDMKMARVIEWALQTQADACLLQLFIAGIIDMNFKGNRASFVVNDRKEAEKRMKEFGLDEYLKLWKKLDRLKRSKTAEKSR